jgi:hypothetical protein
MLQAPDSGCGSDYLVLHRELLAIWSSCSSSSSSSSSNRGVAAFGWQPHHEQNIALIVAVLFCSNAAVG